MAVSPGTKLSQQLTCSYDSFAGSSHLADDLNDFTCDLNRNCDLSLLPKDPLQQVASGSPDLLDRSLTDEDCSSQITLTRVYAVSVTFAIGVTIALMLHIYLGESLVFVKGVVVSDHERCTALGQRVLRDRGSSVDAAITAALCLGVVHPHVSGVGGGGVMLVHDIHKNETRVINFQGSAPKALKEEILQNVSELKAGLQVGVPGLLRGLHRAHSLYGSLSWEDVVTRAAAVAKEGFNVSFGLAEAISLVKGEQLSQRFRDTFLPGGRALRPGSFLRMSSLAGVLEAGLSNFYDGNFSQEMEDEVRTNGGVLSRDDISNYDVQEEQPVEGLYHEYIIQAPASAGAALISALNHLEGLHLNVNNKTENQTHHWAAQSRDKTMHRLKSHAEALRQRVNSSHSSAHVYSSTVRSLQTELMAEHVVIMGPDDLMVSLASSLSMPFGSRLITPSGVILNSLILDFSRPNNAGGPLLPKQKSRVQPVKRPPSSLMPTIVVPAWRKCGIYVALSSSGGLKQSLSVITQVLISAQSFQKEKNGSLLPHRQLNSTLVHSEYPEEGVQLLNEKDHADERLETNSVVHGILKFKDIITAITVSDSFLYFSS